ncbi:hypothetical protein KY308_01915 [Candidatus Woesearchaeota archaeon]|nr:hypothetical protein [Candidatus Woesearchaeota archaeon]
MICLKSTKISEKQMLKYYCLAILRSVMNPTKNYEYGDEERVLFTGYDSKFGGYSLLLKKRNLRVERYHDYTTPEPVEPEQLPLAVKLAIAMQNKVELEDLVKPNDDIYLMLKEFKNRENCCQK